MKKTSFTLLGLGLVLCLAGQGYTSYFTGSTTDVQTNPTGGVCMMGGGTENDNAMRWFLQGAAGGDVLVIRASGSDGYNEYMYTELGITVNSVETIRFDNAEASNTQYVRERINKAEAIWIAGGDQWDYVSYWRNTPVSSAINAAISQRNIMIGGTSAGMAILGSTYFSAQNGTVTTNTALANPYDQNMTVDQTPFLDVPFLSNVITDTHYNDPDRRGRHMAFLAKASTDSGQTNRGIACNESTAVCITTEGMAIVYGSYPDYNDTAYFLVPNCAIMNNEPESCVAGQPLVWNHNGQAVKVYAVKGTPTGLYSFDLNNWEQGDGGDWEDWSVDNGQLTTTLGQAPNCIPTNTNSIIGIDIKLFPNPANGNRFNIELPTDDYFTISLYDVSGRLLNEWKGQNGNTELFWDFRVAGIYAVEIQSRKYGKGSYQLLVN